LRLLHGDFVRDLRLLIERVPHAGNGVGDFDDRWAGGAILPGRHCRTLIPRPPLRIAVNFAMHVGLRDVSAITQRLHALLVSSAE